MEDADFSDAFCRFIQNNIPSVEAAELLLGLKRARGTPLGLQEAVAAMGPGSAITEAEAVKVLEGLNARGLVIRDAAGYRYREGTEQGHVEMLEKAYRERPVTLVRIVYALRDTKIQSFAEAFRLRKR